MINMEVIEELVKLGIYTAYVKGYKPVSFIIAGGIETGKTSVVEKFKNIKGIFYITDGTAWGMMKEISKKLKNGESVNHIIIPDLTTVISKQEATTKSLLTFFNALTEEGIHTVKTYAVDFDSDKPLQCGLITCITKEYLEYRKTFNFMKRIGLLSRVMFISFSHSPETKAGIAESKRNEENIGHNTSFITLDNLPKEKIDVESDENIYLKITPIIAKLSLLQDSNGYRAQENIQCLLKASAIMDKRTKVNNTDYERILKISKYLGLDYNTV